MESEGTHCRFGQYILLKRAKVWRLCGLCAMGSTISTVSGKRKHSECEEEEGSQNEEDDAVVDVVKR